MPVGHFFVFGVARDPVLRLQSIYQRRARSAWRKDQDASRVESFADFVESFADCGNGKQLGVPSQHAEEMTSSLRIMREYTGLDFLEAVVSTQPSEPVSSPADLGVRRMIEQSFPQDFELYEQNTNRMIREWDRSKKLDVEAALRWMAQAANRFEVAGSILYKLRLRMQNDKDFNLSELNAWEPFEHHRVSSPSTSQQASSV